MAHVVASEGTKDAKKVILDYKVLNSNGEPNLLEVYLHTGWTSDFSLCKNVGGYYDKKY